MTAVDGERPRAVDHGRPRSVDRGRPRSVDAYVGLGANVGDSLGTIEACLHVLDDLPATRVADVSGVYETAPWGGTDDDGVDRDVDQPDYLNAVVRLVTELSPHELLDELLATETAFGRDRDEEERWGPRVLDLDLLLHGEAVVDDPPRLVVPHPRLHERAFVLVPLLEIFAGGRLPDGRKLTGLLSAIAPVTGVDLHVRLSDVPGAGSPIGIERPEGPGAPAAVQAPDWDGFRDVGGAS